MPSPAEAAPGSSFPLPVVDISQETRRHVIIAQGTPDVYQGHPTTVLLPDGKTMYAVWTIDHGGFCGPMKRSDDGGLTWSPLLDTPGSWKTVKDCPTIWRLADPGGHYRLVTYAGRKPGAGQSMCMSYSEDDGKTWSEMVSLGFAQRGMPFTTVVPIRDGKALLGLTNVRRPVETGDNKSWLIAQSVSIDGGLTWEPWKTVVDRPEITVTEPWVVRSPDGKELLCLMREDQRKVSHGMFSRDEGETWSAPEPLPAGLHGDRHVAKYLSDGRLIVAFRDKERGSRTFNHFVAWVGRYEDIVAGKASGYRVKLLDSALAPGSGDCGYPAIEILPDGTIVTTTYIKYKPGEEKHSVVSTRFKIDELDRLARKEGWRAN